MIKNNSVPRPSFKHTDLSILIIHNMLPERTQAEQAEPKSTFEGYELQGTLGKGSFGKVKLATLNGQKYAIKFLSNKLPASMYQTNKELLLKEIQILKRLKHENLVTYIGSSPAGIYTKKTGKQYERIGLVLEYLSGFDLFEVLQQGPLGDALGRTYFHQLINGLEYLHNNSTIHRDLKPQNILFDDHLNLRITDFGLSKIIEKQAPTTICGTSGYKSPEMLMKINYNGILNDLFSAGVLLMNLVTGRSPFNSADPKTGMYKYIATNQHQKFWAEFEKKVSIDPDLKTLVNSMLAFDPTQRMTISEIRSHPWFVKDVLMGEDLKNEMAPRIEAIRNRKSSDKMLKQLAVKTSKVPTTQKAFRQFDKPQQSQDRPLVKRKFNPLITHSTDIYVRSVKSLKRLAGVFQPLCTEVRMFTEGETKLLLKRVADNEAITMNVRVLEVTESVDCLRLEKVEGSIDTFLQLVRDITEAFE